MAGALSPHSSPGASLGWVGMCRRLERARVSLLSLTLFLG